MADSANQFVGEILTGTVRLLDIPAPMQVAVDTAYQEVGLWLADHLDSEDPWKIYPQGSMRLGTVVRPSEADEFDLDAVAECSIAKERTTQAALKQCVGDALASYVKAKAGDAGAAIRCDEGKRCWTLGFRLPFHMDFLPAIPDPEAPPTGIQLTDLTYRNWLWSNPIAFAQWFHQQSRHMYELRAAMAKSLQVNIEDVPEWHVRTTLQQAVQALKVHRDIHFAKDLESRPPSVLLTTLAGLAYGGERQVFDAIMAIAADMHSFIDRDGTDYVVLNPVQPPDRPENFADRWGKDTQLVKKFYGWLSALQRALEEASGTRTGSQDVVLRLGASFGMTPVQKAAKEYAANQTRSRTSGALSVTGAGLLTTGAGIARVREHTFHGE